MFSSLYLENTAGVKLSGLDTGVNSFWLAPPMAKFSCRRRNITVYKAADKTFAEKKLPGIDLIKSFIVYTLGLLEINVLVAKDNPLPKLLSITNSCNETM